LILRELATQIHKVLEPFVLALAASSTYPTITSNLIIGGESKKSISKSFQPSDIIVATPGRLDGIMMNNPKLWKQVEVLVLDEADRLLELGFEKILMKVLSKLPKQRRTGLFSATMTEALKGVVKVGLRNPARIVVNVKEHTSQPISKDNDMDNDNDNDNDNDEHHSHHHSNHDNNVTEPLPLLANQKTPTNLKVYYKAVQPDSKIYELIRTVLKWGNDVKGIVYFATCACVDYFWKMVKQGGYLKGWDLYSLHGKMDVKRRHGKRVVLFLFI